VKDEIIPLLYDFSVLQKRLSGTGEKERTNLTVRVLNRSDCA
jgi:hypothetical protein